MIELEYLNKATGDAVVKLDDNYYYMRNGEQRNFFGTESGTWVYDRWTNILMHPAEKGDRIPELVLEALEKYADDAHEKVVEEMADNPKHHAYVMMPPIKVDWDEIMKDDAE